eukprot:3325833-Pleurochrysis_carterae.AAC.1
MTKYGPTASCRARRNARVEVGTCQDKSGRTLSTCALFVTSGFTDHQAYGSWAWTASQRCGTLVAAFQLGRAARMRNDKLREAAGALRLSRGAVSLSHTHSISLSFSLARWRPPSLPSSLPPSLPPYPPIYLSTYLSTYLFQKPARAGTHLRKLSSLLSPVPPCLFHGYFLCRSRSTLTIFPFSLLAPPRVMFGDIATVATSRLFVLLPATVLPSSSPFVLPALLPPLPFSLVCSVSPSN